MTKSQEVVIRASGLTRRFGKMLAVDGIDLEVRRGEVFGFLGPNGAGKSTTIRMLTGLLSSSAGEVEVLGYKLPGDAEALKPKVGYMTQRFSLYEDLSILENLQFAGEVFGLSGKKGRARVNELLDEHELRDRKQQRAGSLSGGWKQRLALAVATIHQPQLLILDEPTAGVDPSRRRAFWEKLFELAAVGTTILVSTHYMDEAVRCHRLAMIRGGRLAALGSPDELTAKLNDRVLELHATPQEVAIATLNQLPSVASVTQMGHQVHVLLKENSNKAQDAAPALLEALRSAGIDEPRVLSTEPTLEDVFVTLSLPSSEAA